MQHGTPVHRGYCETYLGGSALQPFHQIVRSILLHDHHVDPAAGGATLADALERLVPGHGATLTRWFGAAGPDAPPVPFADLAPALAALADRAAAERKSVVVGQGVSVQGSLGGGRLLK